MKLDEITERVENTSQGLSPGALQWQKTGEKGNHTKKAKGSCYQGAKRVSRRSDQCQVLLMVKFDEG